MGKIILFGQNKLKYNFEQAFSKAARNGDGEKNRESRTRRGYDGFSNKETIRGETQAEELLSGDQDIGQNLPPQRENEGQDLCYRLPRMKRLIL